METLSDRLKQKRIELNLTQTQLAELSGTNQQTVQQVESGKTKRPRYIVELAQALNCDPLWLLYGNTKNAA
ncbi:helix-turn-helix transcriptional regulator [Enterobacter sp. A103]|jgi:transcriptional regulator with XRE-family HTH domain|uniref:helix-turn-helix domain-containing protein n=1 Tax=Enterobacter sp. A103 TaxID=3102785 RepID=UPI002ACAEC3E|nr:helix-turn-helix transcriptional regulator [Enterobacter sp. A103]MDZ5639002.1 helix-turn-helix transcriptional regulator [Enterobacter sp. A103]